MRQNDTPEVISARRGHAAHAMATRAPRETMGAVARRGGVSRSTIFRYLKDDSFVEDVNRRMEQMVVRRRPAVLEALVRKAEDGSPWAIRIFFQLTGDLSPDNAPQAGRVEVLVNPAVLRDVPQLDGGEESTEDVREDEGTGSEPGAG